MTSVLPATRPPARRSSAGPVRLVRRVLASDLVDKLTAPHGIDRYLELVDPSWTVRDAPHASTAPATVGACGLPTTELASESDGLDQRAGTDPVTFGRTGTTVAAAGTLLETAEAAGLNPKFGCRRGICGTCTTTKTAGVVRQVVTGVESGAGSEPIRLCVSQACGPVALDL